MSLAHGPRLGPLVGDDESDGTRPVAALYVQCALDVRSETERLRGGFAMSDACRAHATSWVRMPSGVMAWRCDQHRGIVSVVIGETGTTVQVQA